MITLEISQRDIDLAVKCRNLRNDGKARGFQSYTSSSCPIANAMRRKFRNKVSVYSVASVTKKLKNGNVSARYFKLERSALDLLINFDTGKEIFPTAVHLTEQTK